MVAEFRSDPRPGGGAEAPSSPLWRGSNLQRLRIASGLVLFTFAFFHLLNHALGVWSVAAMEAFQDWRLAVTQFGPVGILLSTAFLTHLTLNAWKIMRRTTWRMPFWEAAQIGLGLAIPVLLAGHAAFVVARDELLGLPVRYSDLLPGLWQNALPQTVLVLVVWTHGCIGLHFWLRLARGYRRIAPVLLAIAVLVPALGLAGFAAAGRDARPAVENRAPGYGTAAADESRWTVEDVQAAASWSAWSVIALIGTVLAGRAALLMTHPKIRVTYSGGPTVLAPVGPTLLEISRMNGIGHAAVCGGRARCSTCRVRIEGGAAGLPAPSTAEAATLKRVRAAPDVRLACQLRPRADMIVTRLVHTPDQTRAGAVPASEQAGTEHTLAILFLDIRGFTPLSETRLPYDTVFLLNRFFADTGEAARASGGWIDKYLGDGMMVLFGLSQPVGEACRSALTAAMRIDAALEKLNRELSGELPAPLRIGMGLHVGPLVVGRIGHGASAATTVIGPAVNVASRLESLTKEFAVQIIASGAVMAHAGLPAQLFPETEVAVRGSSASLRVHLVAQGRDLADALDQARPAA